MGHKLYVNTTIQITHNEDCALHIADKMCHAHYHTQYPEKSFFMLQSFRRSVWTTSNWFDVN